MFYAITPGVIHAFHKPEDQSAFVGRYNRNPLLAPTEKAKIISYEKRSLFKTKSNRYIAYDNFSGHYMHDIDFEMTEQRMAFGSQQIAEHEPVIRIPRSFP